MLRHSPIPAEHRHNSIRQGQDILFWNKVIKYSIPMTLRTPRANAWSVHLADSATHESVCMYMRALARAHTHTMYSVRMVYQLRDTEDGIIIMMLHVHLQCMFECKVNFILLHICSTQLITYFTCSHFS